MRNMDILDKIAESIENIEPYGIEPDFSSLGVEPYEVLGFNSDEELENSLNFLMQEIYKSDNCLNGC